MLCEELKPTVSALSAQIKTKESDAIKAQTNAFTESGGKIDCVPCGASGLDGGILFMPECKGATPITNTTKAFAKKGRKGAEANKLASTKKAFMREAVIKEKVITVRVNIRKTLTDKYELIITSTHYGVFDLLQDAIDKRQNVRALLKMNFISENK